MYRVLYDFQFDSVVRDEHMSPVNEFERGFAFADAADARKQHSDAVDVQESSVYSGFRRKKIVQEIDDIVDDFRRYRVRLQNRRVVLFRKVKHILARFEPP